MGYENARKIGIMFLTVPLNLGVLLHFLAVIFGLGLTLRSVDFISFSIQNIPMACLAIFGSCITLGFMMISSILFKNGFLVEKEQNKGLATIAIILKFFWIFSCLLNTYAIYVSTLRFLVSNPGVLGTDRQFAEQTLPLTNFTINAQLDFKVLPAEQLIVVSLIALIVIFCPILFSYLRDE